MNTVNASTTIDHRGKTFSSEKEPAISSPPSRPITEHASWTQAAALAAILGALNTSGCQNADHVNVRDDISSQPTEIFKDPSARYPSASSQLKQSDSTASQPEKGENEEERQKRILVGIIQENLSNPEAWKKSGGFYLEFYPYHLFKAMLDLLPQPKNSQPIDLGIGNTLAPITSRTVDAGTLHRIDPVLEQLLQRIAYLNPREFSKKFPDAKTQEEIFQFFVKSHPLWKDKKYAQEIVAIYEAIQKRDFRKEAQKLSFVEKTSSSPAP